MYIWTVAYHLYQLPCRNWALRKTYKGLNKWFWKHYTYVTQTAGYYWQESWLVWQTKKPWPKMLTYHGVFHGQPQTNSSNYRQLVDKYKKKTD